MTMDSVSDEAGRPALNLGLLQMYLQQLMVYDEPLAASQIQLLIMGKHLHVPAIRSAYGASFHDNDDPEATVENAVKFIALLKPNHANFLDCVPYYSANGPGGTWDGRNHRVFKNIAVRFSLSLDAMCFPNPEAYYEGEQKLVEMDEIQPNKLPYGVVRLIVWAKDQQPWYGTGAIIDSGIIMSAAHNFVHDGGHAYAVQVIAGRGSTSQLQIGTSFAVHGSWYALREPANDIAFIKLREPFNTSPLRYRQTPTSSTPVTIYGFSKSAKLFDPAGRLCKSSSPTQYNERLQLIHHRASTSVGASGGPAVNDSGEIIGVHTGDSGLANHAVMINRAGNNVAAFLQVLGGEPVSSVPHSQPIVTEVGKTVNKNVTIFKW